MSSSTTPDPRLQAIHRFYEQLQAADLSGLGALYTEQAFFKDPFNEVSGLVAIRAIFTHMFEALDAPRFEIRDAFSQGDQAFLSWDFHFRLKGRSSPQTIHGSSHLRWASDGRVSYHRDYWDAAEELYEKLPLLGALLRWIKKRLQVTA